jgi:hypothetical protein
VGSSLPSLIAIGAACVLLSCSRGDHGLEHAPEAVGEIGLALTPVPNLTLAGFTYTVTGPGGFTRSATVDVSRSSTLSVEIGGLPVGSGFRVTISAVSLDGETRCLGSADFSVSADATSKVLVNLQCHETPKTGSALMFSIQGQPVRMSRRFARYATWGFARPKRSRRLRRFEPPTWVMWIRGPSFARRSRRWFVPTATA